MSNCARRELAPAARSRARVHGAVTSLILLAVRELRWRAAVAGALTASFALTEGAALVLLVPLLQSIGLTAADGGTRITGVVTRAFDLIGAQPTMPGVLLLFLLVATAHALLYRVNNLFQPAMEQRIAFALRRRLYSAVMCAEWSFLVLRRGADLQHTVTVQIDRVSASVYHLLAALTSLAVGCVYVAVALRLSPSLTVFAAGLGAVFLWSERQRTRRAEELGHLYSDADRVHFHTVSESFAAVKLAKTLGAEQRGADVCLARGRERSAAYLRLMQSFTDAKMRLDLTMALAISGVLLVAVEMLGLRGVELLVLVFIFNRVFPRVSSLQAAGQTAVAGVAALDAVMQLASDAEAHADTASRRPVARLPVRSQVRLEDVTFAYTAGGRPVLHGVSVAIPARSLTAIVGPSGAGKSTLADILIGLLPPEAGQLTVDGEPVTGAQRQGWRRSVGYVPQEGFLLHDTIRANLLWAKPDATDAEIWAVLARAAAADFVAARPEGLDSIVGDRGVRLSGGERQRLALARALLAGPELLVLDEATSALDARNEQLILQVIDELRSSVTAVIITHRLSAIRRADAIHVLDGGTIVESGTWTTLLERGGVFSRLVAAQDIVTATIPARPIAHAV